MAGSAKEGYGLKLYEVSDTDGRLRIVLDEGEDEPPYMRGVGRFASPSELERHVTEAAILASSPRRDRWGFLYWNTKDGCEKALAAAKRALKKARATNG